MTELDIPSGDQEDQAPPPTTDSGLKETAVDVGMKKDDKNKKPMMIAGLFVCVLLVAAILVGVLPNWKKKDEKKKNTEDTLSTSASRCQEGCLKITDDTFNVTLPLFSERITEGYLTLDEFKEDMKELGKYFLNDAIRNSYWVSYDDAIGITNTEESGQPMPEFDSALTENGTNTGDSSKVSGADAYETNNQEFTVDRADFVKSDGNYMFAAFSDHLVVLAKDGEGVLFKKKMKPIDVNITDPCGGAWGCIEPMPVAIDAEEGATVEVTARSDVFPGWKNPVPRIQALLIHGNHLTAVISGYGAEHSEKLGRTPSIYEYLGTRIQVYEIGSTGDLHLISEQDVNGNFMNAYSKGEFVHIITRSSINTWTLLEPMDRGQPAFEGMDDTQYREAVIKLVDEGLLDRFVEDLISELQVSGPVDLARLSFFTDSIAADNADQDLYYSSLATSISQVVSFDLSAVSGSTTSVGTIQPHMAATFHPGSGGQVYAMGSMVIIAEYSWSWIPDENRSVDKTFLVCFSLSGASSTHSRVGTVDGTLLSPFSLDYVERSSGNYVRVATTQNFWMPWVGTAEGGDQPVSSEAAVTPVEASSTLNQIIVLKVPSDSTASLVSVGSVELGEPNEVCRSSWIGVMCTVYLDMISTMLFSLCNHSDSRPSDSLMTLRTPSRSSRRIRFTSLICPERSPPFLGS